VENNTDKDTLIESLLLERDELYQELSKLRESDKVAIDKKETKNEHFQALLKEKDEKIKQLSDQLAWFRRKFWRAGSEKYIAQDPAQRKIDFEGLEILPEEEDAIKDAAKEIISHERKRPEKPKKKPVRQPLPEYLRRETEVIEPQGIDENWTRIGEEVTEMLEHKPGELYVRRIVRYKYALNKKLQEQNDTNEQGNANIKIGELPLLPIPRSIAGASLIGELLLGKYMFHLPFHRQIAMLKLAGTTLSASTINDIFINSCDLLRALYHRLKEIVLATDYIQIDESTIPVVNDEKHKTVKAYLWVVRSVMDNLVFFHYDQGSRAQRVVVELLKSYKGAVQSDGYEVYSIYENKQGVLLLGCWAHARRKFIEALAEDKVGAEYALEQIELLYRVETMATDQNLDYQKRADLRCRLAYPILCAFEKWIVKYFPKALPKGRMIKALGYTYNLFHRLSRYHLDGRYQMDNNLVENTIRPMALGRKNYLFCGNHDAAENAAIMYSLLGSCKAQEINPREWLIDVLTRIPVYNNDYSLDLADLLPHNWKNSKNSHDTLTNIQ
jgi:transposase